MAGARRHFIENRVIPLSRRLEAEESVTVKAIEMIEFFQAPSFT